MGVKFSQRGNFTLLYCSLSLNVNKGEPCPLALKSPAPISAKPSFMSKITPKGEDYTSKATKYLIGAGVWL